MKCYVYRSSKELDTYLYLPEKDDFSTVPDSLKQVFGRPEFALEFDLSERERLAVTTSDQVMQSIQDQGFYLQMPPRQKSGEKLNS